MSLMELFSNYTPKTKYIEHKAAKGNRGNSPLLPAVTSLDHATYSGNSGNSGNSENRVTELKNKTEPFANPANPANYKPENTVSENRKVAKIAKPTEYEKTLIEVKPVLIKCHDCLNFKCFNQHGQGTGTCLAGVQSNGACWWSDTEHLCRKFDAAVEWVQYEDPQGKTVQCYTPNGKPIEVKATSSEQEAWLMEMNPDRSKTL